MGKQLPTPANTLEKIYKGICCIASKLDGSSTTPQIDIETTSCICRNGTWQYDIITFTNGVETARSTVDTGVSCDDPIPIVTPPQIDFEEACDPTTNTLWRTTILHTWPDPTDQTNVVATQISRVDTGVACGEVNDCDNPTFVKSCEKTWTEILCDAVPEELDQVGIGFPTNFQFSSMPDSEFAAVANSTSPVGVAANARFNPTQAILVNGPTLFVYDLPSFNLVSSSLMPIYDFDGVTQFVAGSANLVIGIEYNQTDGNYYALSWAANPGTSGTGARWKDNYFISRINLAASEAVVVSEFELPNPLNSNFGIPTERPVGFSINDAGEGTVIVEVIATSQATVYSLDNVIGGSIPTQVGSYALPDTVVRANASSAPDGINMWVADGSNNVIELRSPTGAFISTVYTGLFSTASFDSAQFGTEGGEPTKFQRCFTSDSDGVVTTVDLDFNGQPYNVQGEVTQCEEAEVELPDVTGDSCENPTFVRSCDKSWTEILCDVLEPEQDIGIMPFRSEPNNYLPLVQGFGGGAGAISANARVNPTEVLKVQGTIAFPYAWANIDTATNTVINSGTVSYEDINGAAIVGAGPLGGEVIRGGEYYNGQHYVMSVNGVSGSAPTVYILRFDKVTGVARIVSELPRPDNSQDTGKVLVEAMAILDNGDLYLIGTDRSTEEIVHWLADAIEGGTSMTEVARYTAPGVTGEPRAFGGASAPDGVNLWLGLSDASAPTTVDLYTPTGSFIENVYSGLAIYSSMDSATWIQTPGVNTKFQRCYTSDNEGNVTTADLDFNGQPYTTVGQVGLCVEEEIVEEERVETELVYCCLVDDTLGDGTVVVPFTRVSSIDKTTGVVSFIGNKTSCLSEDYTVLGNVSTPCEIGDAAKLTQQIASVEEGGTFNIPSDVVSYSIIIMATSALSDIFAPAGQFIGSDGSVANVYVGNNISYSAQEISIPGLANGGQVTTNSGYRAIIAYQTITS